jgi:hypothetical protein
MTTQLIDKISGDEALKILRRLAEKDPKIRKQIEEVAEQILKEVDVEEICEEVYFALDEIRVEELWDRAGPKRDGYTSPDEIAVEMMEEVLEPYNEGVVRYLKLGMAQEAKLYCMGVLKGIYQFEQESKSEFKDWATENAAEFFRDLLEKWQHNPSNQNDLIEMKKFLEKNCSKWANWAIRI